MSWIIKDGFISGVKGDGINLTDAPSGTVVSGMVISDIGGNGITIGRSSNTLEEPNNQSMRVIDLLDRIESHLNELNDTDQTTVKTWLERIREDDSTFNTRRGIKVIYDIAVGTTGSSIANLLSSLVNNS